MGAFRAADVNPNTLPEIIRMILSVFPEYLWIVEKSEGKVSPIEPIGRENEMIY